MGLPAQFTAIQEKADELPEKWANSSLHQLPLVAEAFFENKKNVRDVHRIHRNEARSDTQPQTPAQQQTPQANVQSTRPAPATDAATQAR